MKVLFSGYRYPHFISITEYIEKALNMTDCQVVFFDNRNFFIPGRIRDKITYLNDLDLWRINEKLFLKVKSFKPLLFLETGGHRIFPKTIKRIKKYGITTILWTIDPPLIFEPIMESAPYYDYVFTGGSEAYDILKKLGLKNLYWLPFACDPDYHHPVTVSDGDKNKYACDVCFVGSWYPVREALLEAISDFNLGIWGSGWDNVSKNSPLKKCIKGLHTKPEEWVKIYSASKIILAPHYQDFSGKIPCAQASPRIYEALACGGFLMTNHQEDVLRLFLPSKELVIYENKEDLIRLVSYYLKRPEKRAMIASRGREKVLNNHTYVHRIKEMLRVINLSG
jgi:spore maturation protein CgeB